MRIIFLTPLLLLGACQVSNDDANDTVSVTYNEDVAANAADDVGNAAENLAGAVSNDIQQSADKVQNKVGDVDVDVTTDNTATNAQ